MSAEPGAPELMAEDWLWRCSRCRGGFLLLVRLPKGDLCGRCALETGAGPKASAAEVFEREQLTRERMVERGGTDKYRVAAGKS